MHYPFEGEKVISSRFGFRLNPFKTGERSKIQVWHSGVDFAIPTGTTIRSCYRGKVVFTGDRGNYGKCIIIEHYSLGKVWSLYAHLKSLLVRNGKLVDVKEPIASSDNTGLSTGPHLHFELRVGKNGIIYAVDPMKHLRDV